MLSQRNLCRDLRLFVCLYLFLCFLSFCVFLFWVCVGAVGSINSVLVADFFLAVLWGSPLRSVHSFLTYTLAHIHMQASSSRNSSMLFPMKLIFTLQYWCGSVTRSWPTSLYFTVVGFNLQGQGIFIDISVSLLVFSFNTWTCNDLKSKIA